MEAIAHWVNQLDDEGLTPQQIAKRLGQPVWLVKQTIAANDAFTGELTCPDCGSKAHCEHSERAEDFMSSGEAYVTPVKGERLENGDIRELKQALRRFK